jgi:uncharacterized protein YdeI (YjbR/CyaY-like superfamily)
LESSFQQRVIDPANRNAYFGNQKKWEEELKKLRVTLLDSELTEEFKQDRWVVN